MQDVNYNRKEPAEGVPHTGTAAMLQAAFISSYLHSAIIYVCVLLFAFTTYFTASFPLGSISQVYDALTIRTAVRVWNPSETVL